LRSGDYAGAVAADLRAIEAIAGALDGSGKPFVGTSGTLTQGVPAASIAAEDAGEQFGFLGALVGLDNSTSSAATQELLRWTPTHPGLIADLDRGHYFEPARSAAV
jgi:hypothetical protein